MAFLFPEGYKPTWLPCLLLATSTAAWAGYAVAENAVTREAHDDALAWNPCPDFMPEGCRIAVLHGDPAEPGADVFFQVPGGTDVPTHWHSSAERMVLVEGELRVEYQDQPAMTLAPGTYAHGPARAAHRASCLSESPCTLFIAFTGPVDAHSGRPDMP